MENDGLRAFTMCCVLHMCVCVCVCRYLCLYLTYNFYFGLVLLHVLWFSIQNFFVQGELNLRMLYIHIDIFFYYGGLDNVGENWLAACLRHGHEFSIWIIIILPLHSFTSATLLFMVCSCDYSKLYILQSLKYRRW